MSNQAIAGCESCATTLGRDGCPLHRNPPATDPQTGIKPISEWGSACQRGFVGDARFASKTGEQVIKRTNRNTTRKWIRSGKKP